MKKWPIIAAIFLLVLGGLWISWDVIAGGDGSFSGRHRWKITPERIADEAETLARKSSRSRPRAASGRGATHRPDQLRDFMLPNLVIDGLTLSEASAKVKTAYEEACALAGETALPLGFVIPPGSDRKLRLQLGFRNLNSSVQLLGALSGLKVCRTGARYVFTKRAEPDKQVHRRLLQAVGLLEDLRKISDMNPPAKEGPFARGKSEEPDVRSWSDCLAQMGLIPDPSTKISSSPSGETIIETQSTADLSAIDALQEISKREVNAQQKITIKAVEIPAGSDWSYEGGDDLKSEEAVELMGQISKIQDVKLFTLPSVTSRPGQSAKMEIIREYQIPVGDSGTEFETQNAGTEISFSGNPLAFGILSDLNYQFSTADTESSDRTVIEVQNKFSDDGYSKDGGTRLHITTHADGSRSVVLFTQDLLDATGRTTYDRALGP